MLKSGISILSTRQMSWRMCLVGRLVQVSIILEDGCPQQAVSCVLMSGDVILAITIKNWSASYICYIAILSSSTSKIKLYLKHLKLCWRFLNQECFFSFNFFFNVGLSLLSCKSRWMQITGIEHWISNTFFTPWGKRLIPATFFSLSTVSDLKNNSSNRLVCCLYQPTFASHLYRVDLKW